MDIPVNESDDDRELLHRRRPRQRERHTKNSRFLNFVAFIPIRCKCQTYANFPGADNLGTAFKFRKVKERFVVACLRPT